ncbi:MAG: methyltransferase domain-containing protein [Desulfuromonadales bacterium]|nr:methyltransferase domain-containing protein [Desulfuromonadales bacterium]
MGVYSWLMAKGYDLAMYKTEQRCLQKWRSELLLRATGELLEIGAGTGVNLPHYPTHLKRLTLSEPDRHMRLKLQKKLSTEQQHPTRIAAWGAEQIGLPDQSVDTIVSTLVLCSVNDQQQALKELHRLLRPGGQLLFLEHVIARNPGTVRWQKLCEPFWSCCSGNCRLTRDTAGAIEAAGLQIERLTEDDMTPAPTIIKRTIRGVARKTS